MAGSNQLLKIKNGLSLWHALNLLRKCARLARSQAITVSAICGPAGLNDFFASKNCLGLRSPILILIQIKYPMLIYDREHRIDSTLNHKNRTHQMHQQQSPPSTIKTHHFVQGAPPSYKLEYHLTL